MANRYMTQFPLTFEKKVCSLFGKVAFGAVGVPTLSAVNSKGIVSITRNSAGNYTFVFGTQAGKLDTYVKMLNASVIFNTGSATAPASPLMHIQTDSIATVGTSSLRIQLSVGGVATDPASGEIGYFGFMLGDSTAP